MTYLPAGLPAPVTESDGLDLPYWEATRQGVLKVQRCGACNTWQWGPEWLCHHCRSWDMRWVAVEGRASIWTWTRCWHPVHPALKDHGPYIAVLVELPHAGNIRMLGNLLGDPRPGGDDRRAGRGGVRTARRRRRALHPGAVAHGVTDASKARPRR